jgi:hypothetical protein
MSRRTQKKHYLAFDVQKPKKIIIDKMLEKK